MMAKKIIYFLCTGNSCRIQMAEGWAKKYLDDKWEVHSAGIEAHGLNKRAIKVMKEVDVDISKQTSNIINFDILNQTDLVVTLCSDARDKCPVIPSHIRHEHWGFDDPARLEWSEFRRVRDEIKERILHFSKICV